jgi:hypothetical protein
MFGAVYAREHRRMFRTFNTLLSSPRSPSPYNSASPSCRVRSGTAVFVSSATQGFGHIESLVG